MKSRFLILILLITVMLSGCLKNNKDVTSDINQVNIISSNELLKLAPEREEIKEKILESLNKSEPESIIKRSPEAGNYYFALSDEKVIVNGVDGTIEVEFIYIDNYTQGTSEVTYEGKVDYTYQIQNIDGENTWIYISSQVVLMDIPKGNIQGRISWLEQGAENIKVYGKQDTEFTPIAITDSNGLFNIYNVLTGTYELFIYGDVFEKQKISDAVVSEDITFDIGTVEVMPIETVNYTAFHGYVYLDTQETIPFENITVWAEKDGIAVGSPYTTDNTGYYFINNIPAGNYTLYAQIELNTDSKAITVSSQNYGTAIRNNFILPNTDPVITYTSPEDDLRFARGVEQLFTVEASDIDGDILDYEWSSTAGTLSVSLNTATLDADFDGTCEVKCIVKDNHGSSLEKKWNFNVGIFSINNQCFTIGIAANTFIYYKDKYWSFGGSTGSYKNYVWSSEDAKNWDFQGYAPWTPRGYHTSVVYNDKVYIIGGATSNGSVNDVWHFDGLTWTQDTSEANFSPRHLHTSVVFNNKIWVIGGYTSDNTSNQVWSSNNGKDWILEKNNAEFGQLSSHASVVYNNEIWVLGGLKNDAYINEVWTSSDGIFWEQKSFDNIFSIRARMAYVLHDNEIYLLGGVIYGSTTKDSNIWRLRNNSWDLISDNEFPARDRFNAISNGKDILFLGGVTGNYYYNDCWTLKFD